MCLHSSLKLIRSIIFLGKILDVGADWGLIDPRTNIFSADTRYNLRTDDGADIYIRTSGPKGPDGHLHLRLIFETASPKYYWMNNILGEFGLYCTLYRYRVLWLTLL